MESFIVFPHNVGWLRAIELPRSFKWEIWNIVQTTKPESSTIFHPTTLKDNIKGARQNRIILPSTTSTTSQSRIVVKHLKVNTKSSLSALKAKRSRLYSTPYSTSTYKSTSGESDSVGRANKFSTNENMQHDFQENKPMFKNASTSLFSTTTNNWYETVSTKSDIFHVYTEILPIHEREKSTTPQITSKPSNIGLKSQVTSKTDVKKSSNFFTPTNNNPDRKQLIDSASVRGALKSINRKDAQPINKQMIDSLAAQEALELVYKTSNSNLNRASGGQSSTIAKLPRWYIAPNEHPSISKKKAFTRKGAATVSDTSSDIVSTKSYKNNYSRWDTKSQISPDENEYEPFQEKSSNEKSNRMPLNIMTINTKKSIIDSNSKDDSLEIVLDHLVHETVKLQKSTEKQLQIVKL